MRSKRALIPPRLASPQARKLKLCQNNQNAPTSPVQIQKTCIYTTFRHLNSRLGGEGEYLEYIYKFLKIGT